MRCRWLSGKEVVRVRCGAGLKAKRGNPCKVPSYGGGNVRAEAFGDYGWAMLKNEGHEGA